MEEWTTPLPLLVMFYGTLGFMVFLVFGIIYFVWQDFKVNKEIKARITKILELEDERRRQEKRKIEDDIRREEIRRDEKRKICPKCGKKYDEESYVVFKRGLEKDLYCQCECGHEIFKTIKRR